MWKLTNILDPIQPALDPDVFDDPGGKKPQVKGHICEWVTNHVRSVMAAGAWPNPDKKVKLVLTGSLTTYQWSERSDFDLSLFLKYDNISAPARADLLGLLVDNLDGVLVPDTTHVLQCYVVPSSLDFDDLYRPGLRSGYDLDKRKWIVPPEKARARDPYKEMPATVQYAHEQEDKLKLLLKYDPPGAKEFWKQLHTRRRRDQAAGKGDYSESNIIFKWLANAGLFPEISAATGEYLATTKMGMPDYTQAPQFAQDWESSPFGQQTKTSPYAPQNSKGETPNTYMGLNWQVKPGAIEQFQNLQQYPLKYPVRVTNVPYPEYGTRTSLRDYWENQRAGQHTFIDAGDNSRHIIEINPMQSPAQANESLWHELQHAYQHEEGRFDPTGYKPTDKGGTDATYTDHPVEVDARGMANYMQKYPLVEKSPGTNYNPLWFPNNFHDVGSQYNENTGERWLTPEEGKGFLNSAFGPLFKNEAESSPQSQEGEEGEGSPGMAAEGSIKMAMPPASMAPQFEEDYKNTDTDMGDKSPYFGLDWHVTPGAVEKFQRLQKYPLKYPVKITDLPGPSNGEEDWTGSAADYWMKNPQVPKGDHNFFDRGERSFHHIRLNPMQGYDEANETLWHELQHAYQEEEGRRDLTGYVPYGDNYEEYINHPIEQDANAMMEHMRRYPLTDVSDEWPHYKPNWLPDHYHLDGQWDPGSETYQLTPEQGKRALLREFDF